MSHISLAILSIMLISRCADSNFAGSGAIAKKSTNAKQGPTTQSQIQSDPSSTVTSEDLCINSPFKGQSNTIKNIGSSVRTTFFHKAAATDPGKTNADPSVTGSWRMPASTILN